jgi:hypothetical protein
MGDKAVPSRVTRPLGAGRSIVSALEGHASADPREALSVDAIRGLVTQLRIALPALSSQTDRDKELRVNISTLEAQLTLGRPNRTILLEALRTIRLVLGEMTTSALAAEFLPKIRL